MTYPNIFVGSARRNCELGATNTFAPRPEALGPPHATTFFALVLYFFLRASRTCFWFASHNHRAEFAHAGDTPALTRPLAGFCPSRGRAD